MKSPNEHGTAVFDAYWRCLMERDILQFDEKVEAFASK